MNKAQSEMDKKYMRVLLIAGIMLAFFLVKCFFTPGYFPKPDAQIWSIGTTPASSQGFGQCDATDDCMYFSHWGKHSQVDVYRHDGTFLYSIEFQDSSNGRIYIRCEDGLLYLKLRNNNVFVFRDWELLLGLSEEEADTQGFTNEWFRKGSGRLIVEDGKLVLMNEFGQIAGPVSVPSQITIPSSIVVFGSETNDVIVGCFALMVLCVFLREIFQKR